MALPWSDERRRRAVRLREAVDGHAAQKVDSGEISEHEYERQRLMLRDRLAAEINRRTAKAPPRHFSETLDRSTTTKLIAGLSAFSGLAR